jgi:hypothetical protein
MEEVRTGSLEPSRRERETTFRKKHPLLHPSRRVQKFRERKAKREKKDSNKKGRENSSRIVPAQNLSFDTMDGMKRLTLFTRFPHLWGALRVTSKRHLSYYFS